MAICRILKGIIQSRHHEATIMVAIVPTLVFISGGVRVSDFNGFLRCVYRLFNNIYKPRTKYDTRRENSCDSTHQLAGSPNTGDSGVLPHRHFFYRKNTAYSRGRSGTEASRATTDSKSPSRGTRLVPTLSLRPKYHLAVTIQNPFWGGVSTRVESEHPIDVYIVDETGLSNFRTGLQFSRYDGIEGTTLWDKRIRLPFSGRGYLLLVNSGVSPVAIHYEIS